MRNYAEIKSKTLDYYGINKEMPNNKLMFVQNEHDFFRFIKHFSINDEYYFRGISKSEHKYSGITRRFYNKFKGEYDFRDNQTTKLFNDEIQLIRKFEQKASFLLHGQPSTLDLVATAQHYTVQTRLLDWSSSPLIATLFSLYYEVDECEYYAVLVAKKKQHIVVYGLPTSDKVNFNTPNYIVYADMLINLYNAYDDMKKHFESKTGTDSKSTRHTLYDLGYKMFYDIYHQTHSVKFLRESLNETAVVPEIDVDQFIKNNNEKFYDNKAMFLETCASNERLTNQRGLFQIAIIPTKNYMDELIQQFNIVFINKNLRKKIIKICDCLGIGLYGLMPDCQSIASVINKS